MCLRYGGREDAEGAPTWPTPTVVAHGGAGKTVLQCSWAQPARSSKGRPEPYSNALVKLKLGEFRHNSEFSQGAGRGGGGGSK